MSEITLREAAALTRAGASLIRRWRIPNDAANAILGAPGEPLELFFERLAVLIAIHACLRRILIHPAQCRDWMHRPNTAFDGLSAIQLMARGDVASLDRVLSYLEAEIHG